MPWMDSSATAEDQQTSVPLAPEGRSTLFLIYPSKLTWNMLLRP